MIRTIEPFMGPAFVVIRAGMAEATETFYAATQGAWLRGDPDIEGSDARGEWAPVGHVGDSLSPLRNAKWCRWWDTVDDATWFPNEVDAAALALLVDGQVVRIAEAFKEQGVLVDGVPLESGQRTGAWVNKEKLETWYAATVLFLDIDE